MYSWEHTLTRERESKHKQKAIITTTTTTATIYAQKLKAFFATRSNSNANSAATVDGSFYLSSKLKPKSKPRSRLLLGGFASADRATGDSNKRRPLFVPHVPHCHAKHWDRPTRTHMHMHVYRDNNNNNNNSKMLHRLWRFFRKLPNHSPFCFVFFFVLFFRVGIGQLIVGYNKR